MKPITAQEIVDILEARYAELQASSTLEKAARLNELEIVLSRIDTKQLPEGIPADAAYGRRPTS